MISIIVPIYNAERVIDRCVNSIISQTYKDWELILVNDGSVDKSKDLCNEWVTKDKRIHVIHKENGGVSSSRNAGLEIVIGNYITFIDVDDWIKPDFLQFLVANDADFVACGFEILNKETYCPPKIYVKGGEIGAFLEQNLMTKTFPSPWAKLFNANKIRDNHIRFDTALRLTEDTMFVYEYLIHCDSIAIISESLYVYDGVWGGDKSKYRLKLCELDKMCQIRKEKTTLIEKRFHIHFQDEDYGCGRICYVESFFEKLSIKDCYDFYHKYLPDLSWAEFLSDTRGFPFSCYFDACRIAIQQKTLYKTLCMLKRFSTISHKDIKFDSKRMELLYILINSNLSLAFLYIQIYFVAKRVLSWIKH